MSNEKQDLAALWRHADEASALLKIMGNPVRLMILCTLLQDEYSVGDLHGQLDLSQSALSQHLAILRRNQLVNTRREAQTIFYSLKGEKVQTLMNCLYEIYCA